MPQYGFQSVVPPELKAINRFEDDILYDSCSPISSATEAELFSTPVGGSSGGLTSKSRLHTNMEAAKELPSDEAFEVHGFTMFLTPFIATDTDGTTNKTLLAAMMAGYVELSFRSSRRRYFPIYYVLRFTPSVDVGAISSMSMQAYASPLYGDRGFIPLKNPVLIGRSSGVTLKLTWPTTPNSSGTNATILYFVFLGIRGYPLASN